MALRYVRHRLGQAEYFLLLVQQKVFCGRLIGIATTAGGLAKLAPTAKDSTTILPKNGKERPATDHRQGLVELLHHVLQPQRTGVLQENVWRILEVTGILKFAIHFPVLTVGLQRGLVKVIKAADVGIGR